MDDAGGGYLVASISWIPADVTSQVFSKQMTVRESNGISAM